MKVRVRATVTEITEWSRDEQAIAGDSSHESPSEVMHLVADEVAQKLEDCTFEPEGLPFECEFELESDGDGVTKDEVKDGALEEYVGKFCSGDYVKPVDCELEWEFVGAKMYTVYMRRVEVYDLPVNVLSDSAENAEKRVREADRDNRYDGVWNELQPDVTTTYVTEESDSPERGEGPLA